MAFLEGLSNFFQSILFSSSPEVKKRQALKKIENELREAVPVIYKNSLVHENFAESLRILFENTKMIGDILADTICNEDIQRSAIFEEQLLLTGFPPEIQDLLQTLSYENRKAGARQSDSITRFLENEHRQLEKIVKHLNTPEFVKIDAVINKIKQLNDICRFDYITALRLFDNKFSGAPDYTPNFQAIPVDLLETSLKDLYYVGADMDISNSVSNAIIALYQLCHRSSYRSEDGEEIYEKLKKIQGIMRQVMNSENMLNLIRLAKKTPDYIPPKSGYNGNARQKYADYLEDRFNVEGLRLKNELQDEKISEELNRIFQGMNMDPVRGYSNEMNALLKQSTPTSFTFVMPMQILKTFTRNFYEEHLKPLLNDIVIEGFFNNAAYKSNFSTDVYALNECMDVIKSFEGRFSRNGDFDEANLTSLIRDSHKDVAFLNRLKEMVEKINRTAKDLIQEQVNNFFRVYKLVGEILVESKTASSNNITNLRILLLSSRNRDNSECMEKQHGLWPLFFEIMKNYVIITNTEKK
ncbi:MAG: hypothetical protein J6X11_01765 [Treponema sp.]|nr:hypothetical protein [Treponema sp.]